MENKENWLDQFGQLAFQNKYNPYMFAHRAYHWVDRIIFIDETSGSRLNVGQGLFSEFDIENWIPITKEEYSYIKKGFRQVIAIRRELKINKILDEKFL